MRQVGPELTEWRASTWRAKRVTRAVAPWPQQCYPLVDGHADASDVNGSWR